ncbi:hypothetical protein ON010_g3009 [Phytophthora cinnamomi]|nr:hypothetical protein ON010_g3009 [Phytophthora cinnamomi]
MLALLRSDLLSIYYHHSQNLTTLGRGEIGVAHAKVVILLVRAAIAALVLATVATAVRPTETTLRRHLRALGDLAEVAAAVRPAMAVPLRLHG